MTLKSGHVGMWFLAIDTIFLTGEYIDGFDAKLKITHLKEHIAMHTNLIILFKPPILLYFSDKTISMHLLEVIS